MRIVVLALAATIGLGTTAFAQSTQTGSEPAAKQGTTKQSTTAQGQADSKVPRFKGRLSPAPAYRPRHGAQARACPYKANPAPVSS